MDFSFEAYITGTVRKKIAENAAVKDILPISNPAVSGFGGIHYPSFFCIIFPICTCGGIIKTKGLYSSDIFC